MKKLISSILIACAAVISVSAQETEKKQYLPEAGDWAIGIDAKPLLNFVGNMFNQSSDNTIDSFGGGEPTILAGPTASIVAKYMLTDNWAIKANLGVLINNTKSAVYIRDDEAYILDPLSNAKVADITNRRNSGFSLTAGAEYRTGKKRVQGVFGAGILIGTQSMVTRNTYGNKMTDVNQRPTTNTSYNNGYRTLKSYSQTPDVIAGLVGTAGVEWFVAPKISLGAEVCLRAAYRFRGQNYTVSEGYNASKSEIEKKTDLISPATASFMMDTTTLGGNIYLAFYF